MKRDLLETDYVKRFLVKATLDIPWITFFRRNTGLVTMADGRKFRASLPGQCDTYGIRHGDARHFELEVKRFTKLSPDQERWRDNCLARGWPWLCLGVERGEDPKDTVARWVGGVRAWTQPTSFGSLPSVRWPGVP